MPFPHEDELTRRRSLKRLTKDEARRIAVKNIAKLPELLTRK
jgi:hypothetical protein